MDATAKLPKMLDLNSNIEIHKSYNKEMKEKLKLYLNSNIEIHKFRYAFTRCIWVGAFKF